MKITFHTLIVILISIIVFNCNKTTKYVAYAPARDTITTAPDVRVGDHWRIRKEESDPFNFIVLVVREVKDGYVLYDISFYENGIFHKSTIDAYVFFQSDEINWFVSNNKLYLRK